MRAHTRTHATNSRTRAAVGLRPPAALTTASNSTMGVSARTRHVGPASPVKSQSVGKSEEKSQNVWKFQKISLTLPPWNRNGSSQVSINSPRYGSSSRAP